MPVPCTTACIPTSLTPLLFCEIMLHTAPLGLPISCVPTAALTAMSVIVKQNSGLARNSRPSSLFLIWQFEFQKTM